MSLMHAAALLGREQRHGCTTGVKRAVRHCEDAAGNRQQSACGSFAQGGAGCARDAASRVANSLWALAEAGVTPAPDLSAALLAQK